MRFAEIISHVQSRVSTDDTTTLPRVKREVNLALAEIENKIPDAYWLRAERRIATIGRITDGTIDVSKGGVVVTKASGSLPAAWLSQIQHAYFKADADSNWYRIARWNSATEVELDYPYIGANVSGGTYAIAKVEYVLPADFTRMRAVVQYISPTKVRAIRQKTATMTIPDIMGDGNVGYPAWWWFTDMTREENYSAGTITDATQGSREITGDGSVAWNTTGFNPSGQTFRIDGDEEGYVIERAADADTLWLSEPYRGASFATETKAYKIDPPGLQKMALYPIPTANQIVWIAYLRKAPEMVADDDVPLIPQQHHVTLCRIVESRMLAHLGDTPASDQSEQMMRMLIQELQSEGQRRNQDHIPRLERRMEYAWESYWGPHFNLPGNYEPWTP